MARFVVDEDFDNDIVRGALRRISDLDIVRAQDVGLSGATDPHILEWAAKQGRILLTHDVSTMKGCALGRVQNGLPMPGVFVVNQTSAIGPVIDDLVLVAQCSIEGEWEGQIRYLPF